MTVDPVETPNQASSLSDWLRYMQNIHVSAIDMGLSRVMPVAEHLELLQRAKKDAYVFTVAGTNGKGSTTAVISEICQQAGYKTALYQSPHLIDFNERVRINGDAVGDQTLVNAFVQVEQARLLCNLTLSFFEMTTLAAMLIFAQADCDVWVLEVGLGGRLDVVNIIDPDLAVITNISIDHVDWLGDTREKIGFEKAGILRQCSPLIYGERDMPVTVKERIKELNVVCYQVGQDFDYRIDNVTHINQDGQDTQKNQDRQDKHWQFSSGAVTMQLPSSSLSISNTANAIAAILVSTLDILQEHIAQAIQQVNLAGRFDFRQLKNRQWLFDVAHNSEGMSFLLPQFISLWQQYHQQYISDGIQPKLHIIFSMLADKAIADVAKLLINSGLPITAWHVAEVDAPRAADRSMLTTAIAQYDDNTAIQTYESLQQATYQVVNASLPQDLILVCGSFHTIAEVMQALGIKL